MASGLGDLIQIVDYQTLFNEQLLNVYYYRVTSLTGLNENAYADIANWFVDNIIGPVKAIQSAQLRHTVVQVRNLSNNLDFYELVVDQVGAITATPDQTLPAWITVNFKLVRESLATRNGSKRFSGLIDTLSEGHTYTLAPSVRLPIENALASDIVMGAVTIAEPVIVKSPVTPPVGTSYTYSSIGAALYTKYGTQNTRKP